MEEPKKNGAVTERLDRRGEHIASLVWRLKVIGWAGSKKRVNNNKVEECSAGSKSLYHGPVSRASVLEHPKVAADFPPIAARLTIKTS